MEQNWASIGMCRRKCIKAGNKRGRASLLSVKPHKHQCVSKISYSNQTLIKLYKPKGVVSHLSLGFSRLPFALQLRKSNCRNSCSHTLHLTHTFVNTLKLSLSLHNFVDCRLSIYRFVFLSLEAWAAPFDHRLYYKCLETRRRCGLCSYNTSSTAGNNKSLTQPTVRIEAQNLTDTTEADACCCLLRSNEL